MHKLNCPRCENVFFTAARDMHLPCPYCGFILKTQEHNRRSQDRTAAQKVCDIFKGEVSIPAKTVDISETGMGIKMMGYLPFDPDETVSITIKELDLEKKAQVVWTKKFYGISRAGLRWC